jgi:hypothetical protein
MTYWVVTGSDKVDRCQAGGSTRPAQATPSRNASYTSACQPGMVTAVLNMTQCGEVGVCLPHATFFGVVANVCVQFHRERTCPAQPTRHTTAALTQPDAPTPSLCRRTTTRALRLCSRRISRPGERPWGPLHPLTAPYWNYCEREDGFCSIFPHYLQLSDEVSSFKFSICKTHKRGSLTFLDRATQETWRSKAVSWAHCCGCNTTEKLRRVAFERFRRNRRRAVCNRRLARLIFENPLC